MKFGTLGALIILFVWFAATPSAVAAQEATSGRSADLHAAFEFDYALRATSISLSSADREKVIAIIAEYDNGAVTESDASKRIDTVLSPGERDAVSEIERSFLVSIQQIYADANNGAPLNAPLEDFNAEIDPGDFLLLLLTTPSPSPATLP